MLAVTPQPMAEEVQIFNEICNLAYDAVYSAAPQPRLRQLAWRLKGLAVKQPNNLFVRTAFSNTLIATGQREAGCRELEIAYRLRNRHQVETQLMLMSSSSIVGDFDKALTIAKELVSEPIRAIPKDIHCAVSIVAFLGGDADYLLSLARGSGEDAQDNPAALIIENFGTERLQLLIEHQNIVQSVIQPHAAEFRYYFVDDGEGPPMLSVDFGVYCGKVERKALERKLVRALYDYYAENTTDPPGLGVAAFCPDLYEVAEEALSEASA